MSNTGTTLSMKALLLFTKSDFPRCDQDAWQRNEAHLNIFLFTVGSGIIQKRAQSSHQLSSAISAAAAAALINAFTLWAVLAYYFTKFLSLTNSHIFSSGNEVSGQHRRCSSIAFAHLNLTLYLLPDLD